MKEDILEMMISSLRPLHPDDVAFLFATGKSELILRDFLSSYMHRTLGFSGSEFVAREWQRHDLALVDGSAPMVLVEGKSWAHFDCINQHKLSNAEDSIEKALLRDIQKMRVTARNHPECKKFTTIILFSVDVAHDFPLKYGQLTYGAGHKGAVEKTGSFENLLSKGRENLEALLTEHGEVLVNSLPSGTFSGMSVVVDFFVLEID